MAIARGQSLQELCAARVANLEGAAGAADEASGRSETHAQCPCTDCGFQVSGTQQAGAENGTANARTLKATESLGQAASWNYVYYNIHEYQQRVVGEISGLVASSLAQARPHNFVFDPESIVEHLEIAVQEMNASLVQLRAERQIQSNAAEISKLIATQNKLFVDQLESKLGIDLASLAPTLDFFLELRKRTDAAYLAVKDRLDMTTRSEAQKLSAKTAHKASRISGRESIAAAANPPSTANPALANKDIVGCVVDFVAGDRFIFFASVSRTWRGAWGRRPPSTSLASKETSVSQLRYGLGCGLPKGCPAVCNGLARHGKLEELRYAREIGGYAWSAETSSEAAGAGHLDVLKWLRQHGCPWSCGTCSSAAAQGRLAVLTWARFNGCPWDETTCSRSVSGGHLDALRFARRHGCPWRREECLRLARVMGHEHVLAWLRAF